MSVLAYLRLFNCCIRDSGVDIDCNFAVLETLWDVLAYFRLFNCRISDSDVGIGYFLCRILDSLGLIG